MKILMVSNLYPPFFRGGYEIRCAQVAEDLQRAGHDVLVLTSTYGLRRSSWANIRLSREEVGGVQVCRWLNQYAFEPQPMGRPWTFFQAKRELWDARQFLALLSNFQPDIVNWWSMSGLSKTLLPIPRRWGIPDVHWIEHWWMIDEYGSAGEKASAFWATVWDGNWGPRVFHPLFRLVGKRWEYATQYEGITTRTLSNSPCHVCFVSEYMRTLHCDAGLEFPSSEIIYGGVPAAQFYGPVRNQHDSSSPLRLLYAGQISPDRGLHTAIEALGYMPPSIRARCHMSVAGHNPSGYFSGIKARIQELGLTECVSFLGNVPHDQMPRIYKEHDVLVFPSLRPEGCPLTMVEAMLAGCAVLTTGSGGAMEIATAAGLPLFPKEDSVALSQLLSNLVTNRAEVSRIALRGQEVALREFSFDRMISQWLHTLQRLYQTSPTRISSSSQHEARVDPQAVHG